jgi:hypothetical protein
MPWYKVQLQRSITEQAYVEIEADDPDKAFELAMDEDDPPDSVWEVTDVLYSHPTGLVKDEDDEIVRGE